MILWLFGFLGMGLLGMFFWKRIGFLSYGAAGLWALLGFQALQSSGSPSPVQITDTYMALFWLCIAFVIACSLLPSVMKEKLPKEEFIEDVDGSDLSGFFPTKDNLAANGKT